MKYPQTTLTLSVGRQVLSESAGSPEDGFWSRVDRSGGPLACWPWLGNILARTGYGRVYVAGKAKGAHRHAYELVKGPIPVGLDVCHSCDIPACVNPAHLWTGTPRDNLRDARDKGRLSRVFETGERATFHKLTWAAVRDIRARVAAGESQGEMARKYSVSQPAVSAIVRGVTWPEPDVAAEAVSA